MRTKGQGSPDKELIAPVSSIRTKLTAIIIGISSAAILSTGILVVYVQMKTFRRNLAADNSLHAQMVANNCLAAVSFQDAEDASLILNTLASRKSFAYGSVVNSAGELLASYRRAGFADKPQNLAPEQAQTITAQWILTQAPVILDGKVIGTVFLQSDTSGLDALRHQITSIVASTLAAVFILTWILSIRLQKVISGPIEDLTDVVRDISLRKDYSLRAADLGRDEIGVLARSFNEMLSEVELRDKEIEQRERRTKDYLDVAGVMIIALDTEGRVTLINPKGCAILGLRESDILGKNWFKNFLPERLREEAEGIFAKLKDAESSALHFYENEVLTADGEERLISWNSIVIRDEDGRPISVLRSGEDITDSRQAEDREAALREQLARAERMKSIGFLAGGVAHDLNNVLGPIAVLPDFIKEDLKSALKGDLSAKAEILNSADVLKTSAERATAVVRDLVALGRSGNYERVPMDLAAMDFFSAKRQCISSLEENHPNVAFEITPPDQELNILGSEDHLSRVFDNLIRNAAESVEGKGKVTVKTSMQHLEKTYNGYTNVPPGNYAVVEITDTGCGMHHGQLEQIFQPFYTKKKETSRSGSGLGLSIVNNIVNNHEGYIDVRSTVGRGTTFKLYFPITDAATRTKEPEGQALIRGRGNILIVDDEPGQRYLNSNGLKRLGYTVAIAEDGRSAVSLFEEAKKAGKGSPYDLMLLDMIMYPDFDGLDTLKAVRELYPEQKVLIVSGHAEDDRSAAALDLGASWLSKPYKLHRLASFVAEILQAS